MPIGTIWPYVGDLDKIPTGWHLCDGTESTPDLRDRFLQSYGTNAAMQNIEPGLPNITGSFIKNYDDYVYGAFYTSRSYIVTIPGGGTICQTQAGFDAELGRKYWHNNFYGETPVDIIYGNSKTVQPPAYTVYYIIKIA